MQKLTIIDQNMQKQQMTSAPANTIIQTTNNTQLNQEDNNHAFEAKNILRWALDNQPQK